MKYQCDMCDEEFQIGDDTFVGSLSGDAFCSPFSKIDKLCAKCYTPDDRDQMNAKAYDKHHAATKTAGSAISDKTRDEDERNSWGTPQYVFDYFNRQYKYTFDAAASESNHKCEWYFTIDDDFLTCLDEPCRGERIWINPPYSNIKPWVERARFLAHNYECLVTLLVPMTPEARWWPQDADITFITNGRLSFIDPTTGKAKNGNAKGSALIAFAGRWDGKFTLQYLDRDDMKKGAE